MDDKKIRVSHLVYIIIIAVIILSFFLVIAFGDSENAGAMMGTASTVSSLILSVIAIMMSLIDVAGQKQSMVDLKETAEKLQESNNESQFLIESLINRISEINSLKEDLLQQLVESDEWRKEVKELLSNGNNEEIQKRLEEIVEKEKQSKKWYDYDKSTHSIIRDEVNIRSVPKERALGRLERSIDLFSIYKYLLNNYGLGKEIPHEELSDILLSFDNSLNANDIKGIIRILNQNKILIKMAKGGYRFKGFNY